MKVSIAFLCLAFVSVALTADLTAEEQWTNFKVQFIILCNKNGFNLSLKQNLFGRKFSAEEDQTRFEIFKQNVEFVNEQNAKFARGDSTWGAAINDLSDRTPEEKQQSRGLFVPTPA